MVNDAERHPVAVGDLSRIVVAGGAVTEVVFALGMGANVVGADSSSTFPPEASQRPQVGYVRALGAEGLVALRPTLVLTTMEAGPPAVLQQLAAAQVPVLRVPATPGLDGARARIRLIAEALDRAAQGDAMVATLDREAAAIPTAPAQKQRVVFVMARGSGAPNVAGRATAADAMIALAGGENAVTGYEGYRPLTPESLVQAAPTVLLFTTRGLASVGGEAGALALPGVALTPAGRDRRIVAMDDLELLGFGPRCARAAATLSQRINAAPAPPSASADPSAAPSATATP